MVSLTGLVIRITVDLVLEMLQVSILNFSFRRRNNYY